MGRFTITVGIEVSNFSKNSLISYSFLSIGIQDKGNTSLNMWKLHLTIKSHDEDEKVYILLDKLAINGKEYISHLKEGDHSYFEIESSIKDISETIDDLVEEYLSHCNIPLKDLRVLKKAYKINVRDKD